jgi:hypothetical protein
MDYQSQAMILVRSDIQFVFYRVVVTDMLQQVVIRRESPLNRLQCDLPNDYLFSEKESNLGT